MAFIKIPYVAAILLAAFISDGAIALEESDPLEPLNRKIYSFNKLTDSLLIKPATIVYEKTIPPVAQFSISNFIRNVAEVPVIINGVLQGKGDQATSDIFRLGINSTLGIFGFFDVATQMGFPAHKEDLGKTLYAWGWKNSIFFVIPLIGPSTIRDAVGMVGNLYFQVPSYFKPEWRNRYYFLVLIDRRKDLHEIESIAGVAGVEYYNLVRSGYFQHRQYEFDGTGAAMTDGTTAPVKAPDLGEPPP
jgi:phospholipid-binding lipoprotein MlaA